MQGIISKDKKIDLRQIIVFCGWPSQVITYDVLSDSVIKLTWNTSRKV